jgi:hypothetical protein
VHLSWAVVVVVTLIITEVRMNEVTSEYTLNKKEISNINKKRYIKVYQVIRCLAGAWASMHEYLQSTEVSART